MTSEQFRVQLERLISVYGKNAYPNERGRLIWLEVQNFDAKWLADVIDDFIGHLRTPPMMPEFRTKIAEERERLYRIEKAKHTREAEAFMSRYSGEDLQTICAQIRKRLKGEMSDTEFECFKKMITPP